MNSTLITVIYGAQDNGNNISDLLSLLECRLQEPDTVSLLHTVTPTLKILSAA